MKKHWLMGAILLMASSAVAQEGSFMPVVKTGEIADPVLGGKAAFEVLSPHADLVITVSPDKGASVKKPAQTLTGEYSYVVELELEPRENATKREFSVGRVGKATTSSQVVSARRNYRTQYTAAEVGEPIQLNRTSEGFDSNGEHAVIEIESPIALTITAAPKVKITTKKVEVDGNTTQKYIVTITNVKEIVEAFAALSRAEAEMEALQAKELKGQSTEADDNRFFALEAEIPFLTTALQSYSYVTLKGKETNTCNISMSGIGPKAAWKYAVITMKEKVYASLYMNYYNDGDQARKKLHFGDAKSFYQKALDDPSCPEDAKEGLRYKIQSCESLELLNKQALDNLRKLQDMTADATASQSEINRLYSEALQDYEKIYAETQSNLARKRCDKIRSAIANVPCVVKGLVNGSSRKDMRNGMLSKRYPLQGITVKFVDVANGNVVTEAVTDAEGHFRMELKLTSRGEFEFILPKHMKRNRFAKPSDFTLSYDGRNTDLLKTIYFQDTKDMGLDK